MGFNYAVIAEAMKLMKMTVPALSKLCGTPESTIKKLVRGEIENPTLTTITPVFRVLGLSIDRACGLAPERDIAKEAAEHNVSMVTALQERLSMQDEKIAALKDTIAEQRAEIAAKAATIEAREKSIAHRDQIIRNKDRWIFILVGVVAAFVVLDLLLANAGWFRFGLIK